VNTRASQGFTLAEVLVALLVLALGGLGASAMQLSALRTRHQSGMLSEAVQLVAAIAERMRLNAGLMRLADSDNPYAGVNFEAASDAAPAAPSEPCFSAAGCDGAQLAAADIDEWKQQVKSTFPAGRLAICRDGQAWDPGSRTLRWSCDGSAGAPLVIKLGWRSRLSEADVADEVDTPRVVLPLAGRL
jgi:type IV pilus assembly protein PilV